MMDRVIKALVLILLGLAIIAAVPVIYHLYASPSNCTKPARLL
jgi:hypothetical protein